MCVDGLLSGMGAWSLWEQGLTDIEARSQWSGNEMEATLEVKMSTNSSFYLNAFPYINIHHPGSGRRRVHLHYSNRLSLPANTTGKISIRTSLNF